MALPAMYRRMRVAKLSTQFRDAVDIVTQPMPTPGPGELLVRNRYIGINASDVNYTAGRYNPGTAPPFNIGFEAVGQVVRTGGSDCGDIKEGDAIAIMYDGSFSEYNVVPARRTFRLPRLDAGYVPLLVSALTAAISLEELGDLAPGKTVLVTAAAGGTGQFAVQVAKAAGCKVLGTCSTDEKVRFLRELGCDHAINYKTEDLKKVLRDEYPAGVDCIYESVGGDTFDTCVKSLATHGNLIIIGFITGYENDLGFPMGRYAGMPPMLLRRSASVRGFFLFHHTKKWKSHFLQLASLYEQGKLKSLVDDGSQSGRAPFRGIDSIPDAVEYLYSKQSQGKVVVDLWKDEPSAGTRSRL
eukprot:scpid71088/ scgid28149/ Zinc-binding alcohol dehydrogenase domain-containing protein 2